MRWYPRPRTSLLCSAVASVFYNEFLTGKGVSGLVLGRCSSKDFAMPSTNAALDMVILSMPL